MNMKYDKKNSMKWPCFTVSALSAISAFILFMVLDFGSVPINDNVIVESPEDGVFVAPPSLYVAPPAPVEDLTDPPYLVHQKDGSTNKVKS